MNILIENSRGELITITLQDTDTFRELNRRMQKEYGLQMDFTNLYGEEDIDLDENILTSLSKSNQLIPVEAECNVPIDTVDNIDKSFNEENNLSLQTEDQGEVAAYSDRINLLTAIRNEEMIELPRGYQLISLNPELHLQHDMVIDSENEDVIVRVKDSDTRESTNIENNKLLFPQNLMETATKIVLEITNDVALPLCRLCAHRSDEMVYIFDSTQSGQEIAEKIDDCLPIMVKKTDALPKQICHSCLKKLELCHEFHKTVIEAEMNFLKMDYPKLLYSKAVKKNCPLCQQSTLRTNDNSKDIEISLTKPETRVSLTIASTNVKNTSIDAMQNNDISSKEVASEFTESLEANEEHFFKGRMKNVPAEINQKENTSFTVDKDTDRIPHRNHIPVTTIASSHGRRSLNRSRILRKLEHVEFDTGKNEIHTEHLKKIPKNKQLMISNKTYLEKGSKISYDEQMSQHEGDNYSDFKQQCVNNDIKTDNFLGENNEYKTVKCRICGEAFRTTKKCHLHSRIHSSEGYYPCSLCDKTFTTEEDCNEHSIEHTEGKKCERRSATHACNECGKKFVTEERLQFHVTFHKPDARPCYCNKCNKFMVSESSLYHHLLTVHLQYKEFCCDICGKQFRAQAQLDAHQRKHKDERPFECTICKKRFYSNEILKRHKKLHLPDKPYQCDQCGKRFDRTNTLTKHLLRHQVEAGRSMLCHICTACNEIFVDVSSGNSHITTCKLTEEGSDKRIEERNLSAMYKCEFCERCYTEVKFMKVHRACHGGPQPYVCIICDITYATYNQATAHKSAHKKSSKEANVKENIIIPTYFACEHCDKQFLHYTNMNVHRKACASGKNWTCRYCGFIFENAKELSKHKKGKDGQETWPCEECSMSFGSVCALETHKEIHSEAFVDRKIFVCLYCRKEFTQKTHLTTHIRSHTGERPYACDLCNKAYKIKIERDNHRRTHTGERPFNCTICEKTFTNRARLREHTRFHSGVRPYKCNLCERAFKKTNARKVHMTIHTGEKPYQCDVCNTYFRRMGDMRKHKRTQHSVKEMLENSNSDISKIDYN